MGAKRKRTTNDGTAAATKKVKKGADSSNPTTKPAELALEKRPFIETPTGDERKREANLYDLLGSEDENERIAAADVIISGLLDDGGVPEAVLQRHLDRRLFRGLASGRNASRVGFSLVITEILSQLFGKDSKYAQAYPGLTFYNVLGFLVDKTQAVGNIPGQEERDHYFGQLFGIECFVRSQVVFHDLVRWRTVLDLLLKLSGKKSWLRSQCGWVIVQGVAFMDSKTAESTLERLADVSLAKTPEGVAIWLMALRKFPDLNVKPWRNPLSPKSLADLAAVLRESFQEQANAPESKGQKGGPRHKQANAVPQLHFVWDIIVEQYTSSHTSESDINQFWGRVVDDGLFSRNATDGQKFKGFTVFQKFLEALVDQPSKTKELFSKNLMSCLMNQAAKEDRYLHRAAIKALKSVETISVPRSAAIPITLECLIGRNGAYNFSQRTNTAFVDKLLQRVDAQNVEEVLTVISKPMKALDKQDDQEAQAILRLYIEYLTKILNALTADSPDEDAATDTMDTFIPVLQELSTFAYSRPEGVPASALTESVQQLCRARLETSLAKLAARSQNFGVFCNAVSSIDSSSLVMAEEIKSAVDDALKRMNKLLKRKAKTNADKSLTQGLAMLHAVSILQLYNEDPDAMEVLQDLADYADRLKKGGQESNGQGGSELLVEILLSMVARPSSLMRKVSQQVFEAFTPQISGEGLQLLLEPLSSAENAQGQKELFDTEEDGMEIDDQDDDDGSEGDDDVEEVSDVEIDSDVEFVNIGEGEGDEDGSGSEGAGGEETGEAQEFDDLLGKILRSHRLDKDADAESSVADEDMSDSEALALDDKIAEVFKQQTKNRPDSKKQKKDAKQSVINFKHRILDLLDIYVRREALNPLALSLLVPLLNLMHSTTTKPLGTRACEILLNYQKGMKKARAGGDKPLALEPAALLALLGDVHEAAGKDAWNAYARAASAASLTLASALHALDKESIAQVAAVYAKTQSEWALGKTRAQASFFIDWINWCQNIAGQKKA